MKRLLALIVISALTWSCGSSASPSPVAPTPTPTPVPAATSLSGVVSSTKGGVIAGATVTILDGANAGKSTTAGNNGSYTISNLVAANANISATAAGFEETRHGTFVSGATSLNFALAPVPPPIFTASGSGNTVFDMPTYVTRVHIVGSYPGFTSNFIVNIGGHLVVNELLGTGWASTVSDGVYLTTGGVVQITNSSGVAWSFTEVR